MKRILITGKNSYVGTSLEKWLLNYPDKYIIELISLRDESWKEKDFSIYDVVFHVAGVAHIKETKDNANLFYKVNRDLAYEVAQKAKGDGVNHFIFLSSMSVYGMECGIINNFTNLKPKSNYGKSKLQAEELIKSLDDKRFRVAIIRPPMIYGKGCKGNYTRLANFAVNIPIFPAMDNERSMIFIENLCEFIRILIDDMSNGIFFPQNKEYVCTSEMVKKIAEVHGKKVWLTKIFNPFLRSIQTDVLNKIFGNLVYDQNMSDTGIKYQIYDFKCSINLTERGH